jgi:hypothetical protein
MNSKQQGSGSARFRSASVTMALWRNFGDEKTSVGLVRPRLLRFDSPPSTVRVRAEVLHRYLHSKHVD